ncbi:MAG: M48 family metalloprotease [Gammaproteobacteria bacterium]|nr:M48 family metalloprotease [Gammaproteobacteria bacterium]NIR59133.1 M48 family metalloprotease [Gammaproteobacteria bacterium]
MTGHAQRWCARSRAAARGLGLAALLGVLSGCATNPVTGEPDFVLMSEREEIALGRQYHPQILEEFGRYEDPALRRYVESVGDRLARQSHRPDLVYRFNVLDSPDVNAFALPGGYIYVTRGLLAYLNSEAQLAAVLGHEIGHVTARHAVRQHSAATVTGILGAVIGAQTRSRAAQDVLNVLGTALLRGYGRDMELEADRLGARYLARGGYEPDAMLRVIEVLKDQEEFEKQRAEAEDREPRVYHGVFATHPSNDARLQEVVHAARSLHVAGEPTVQREAFLRKLDGLSFGDSARKGVRRDSRFYHAELGFAIRFPEGWAVENLRDRVVAFAPQRSALLNLRVEDINKRISPREFIEQRLGIDELRQGEALSPAGLEGYTGVAQARTPFGSRLTRVAVIYYEERAYVLLGAAKAADRPFAYDSSFLETARSLHPLSEAERALARPKVLRLIPAEPGTTFAALARRSPIPNHAEAQLRLLNGLYPDGQPEPGALIKIVE